jgi:glyoxylate reductase
VSPKPSILLTGKIPSSVVARLELVGDVDQFRRDGADVIPRDELMARIAGKQALVSMITDSIDRAVIEAGTALKVIANAAVGYNNIDIAAARERGIIVTNTPGVLTDATADLTWALILGITRRIGEGERLIRRGDWRGWTFDFMLGAEIRGKQLGIVGYGGIGRAVAARGRAFGMRVAYTSRTPKDDPEAEPMPFDRLLATSDVVSLHCPLTPETRHLIDQPALARMKRSAYLINTSRGPVVDEKSARLGTAHAVDRRRGARCVRAGTEGGTRAAHAGECLVGSTPWQRDGGDAHRDGGSGSAQCCRGPVWSGAVDARFVIRRIPFSPPRGCSGQPRPRVLSSNSSGNWVGGGQECGGSWDVSGLRCSSASIRHPWLRTMAVPASTRRSR